MNKSLSLVIALAVVIMITVLMTYFDIMNMTRKTVSMTTPVKYIKLTRHNQPATLKTPNRKNYTNKWNKQRFTTEGQRLINQAYLLYRNGKLATAEDKIRTALIFLPHDNNALALLGRILYETGYYDLAEQVFKEQLKYRNSTSAYNNLAEAMARQGKYQQAIKMLDLASKRHPIPANIYLNLAGLHSISGHKNQALRFFSQAFDQLGYKIIPISYDPALNNIHSEPEFKKIIKAAKSMQP